VTDRRAATTTGFGARPNGADPSSPREACVRMTWESAKSMDQGSFRRSCAAEAAGKPASAAHGYPATRQNDSIPGFPKVDLGNGG
jgi:hypothetical protein